MTKSFDFAIGIGPYSGVLSQTLFVGHLFKIYIVVATGFAQKSLGNCLNLSMI